MILAEKVTTLKRDALQALRIAMLWEEKIRVSGEHEAQELYLKLGHNHIERKGISWEGIVISRLPREHEKLMVKALASQQVDAKDKIATILLKLRTNLIASGMKGIKTLAPADYHALTLRAPAEIRTSLRERLIEVHHQGRILVVAELGKKQSVDDEDEFDDLDTLTDLSTSRVANDVQSRIVGAAARFALLGLTGAALFSAIQGELNAGSVSYIDRASTGLANKVLNIGREDEAQNRRDEWSRVEYSALLDQNVCGPCAAADGESGPTEADITPAPNPDCEGGDWCRCFHVFIAV